MSCVKKLAALLCGAWSRKRVPDKETPPRSRCWRVRVGHIVSCRHGKRSSRGGPAANCIGRVRSVRAISICVAR